MILLLSCLEMGLDELGDIVSRFLPRDGVKSFPVTHDHNLMWQFYHAARI